MVAIVKKGWTAIPQLLAAVLVTAILPPCHAAGPPIKRMGYVGNDAGQDHLFATEMSCPPGEWIPGECPPDGWLPGEECMVLDETSAMARSSAPKSSAGRKKCCHGKCSYRNWDGVTRHCGRPAPQYPVPFPTPLPTTPTLLWYPPMMPHNSLPHYRASYSYRHAPGLSRTTVSWQPTYFLNALDKLHHLIELPR